MLKFSIQTALAVMSVTLLGACDLPSEGDPGPANIIITPDPIVLNDSASIQVVVHDDKGVVIDPSRVTFSSTDSTRVAIGAGGVVTGVAPGNAHIIAQVGRAADTVAVAVQPVARTLQLLVDSVIRAEMETPWTVRVLNRQGGGFAGARVELRIRYTTAWINPLVHVDTVVTDSLGYARTVATPRYVGAVLAEARTLGGQELGTVSVAVRVRNNVFIRWEESLDNLVPRDTFAFPDSGCGISAVISGRGAQTWGQGGGFYPVPEYFVGDTTVAVVTRIPLAGGTRGQFGRLLHARRPGTTMVIGVVGDGADTVLVTVAESLGRATVVRIDEAWFELNSGWRGNGEAAAYARVPAGSEYRFFGSVLNACKHQVYGARASWTSTNPDVGTVDQEGRVRYLAPGQVRLIARYGELADTLVRDVYAP